MTITPARRSGLSGRLLLLFPKLRPPATGPIHLCLPPPRPMDPRAPLFLTSGPYGPGTHEPFRPTTHGPYPARRRGLRLFGGALLDLRNRRTHHWLTSLAPDPYEEVRDSPGIRREKRPWANEDARKWRRRSSHLGAGGRDGPWVLSSYKGVGVTSFPWGRRVPLCTHAPSPLRGRAPLICPQVSPTSSRVLASDATLGERGRGGV